MFSGIGLVRLRASFASGCSIRRLRRRGPLGTYTDCGDIFDAMVCGPIRRYTRQSIGGIVDALKQHCGPMFLEK